MNKPIRKELVAALLAASAAHSEFQKNYLAGVHDEQWPGWYAAYVLGRLGDFVTTTQMARWLEAAPLTDEWASTTAEYIFEKWETV